MKAPLIGFLAVVLSQPALAGPTATTNSAAEKFGSAVRLNYTRAYGYHGGGGYHGGHGGYHYPYYGYRYPYWGGYYGYPYAAAFAFGLGIPLAYYSGYYAGAYAPGYYAGGYAPGYAVYQPSGYYRERHARSSSHRTSNSFVTNVQGALKSRGYYTGSVDGVFGPQSQQALTAFQHASNLSETGLLDAPSLNALGVGLNANKTTTASSSRHSPAPTARTPTTEETFVPPPIAAPAGPPEVPAETAPAPLVPPPIPGGTPAPPAQ